MSEHNKNNTFAMKDFHHLHASKTMEILCRSENYHGFFTSVALTYISAILTIAKAYHQIPVGMKFEQQSGYSVDSPYWVSLVCNDADMRRDVVANLASNLNIYKNLKSPELVNALDICNEDWENLQIATETYKSVISVINSIMDVFKDTRFIDNFAHMDDAEICSEFLNSIISQDYSFFDKASAGAKIRATAVAKRKGMDSLSQDSIKAFAIYLSSDRITNNKHS